MVDYLAFFDDQHGNSTMALRFWHGATRGLNPALHTVVQSVNIGIHSAWSKASDHTLWRRIVDTATLHHGARH